MPEDLNKDRLEDFFKNTFDDQSNMSNPDGWDVPGDQVWDKVETAIEEDKKDRKLVWWWVWGIGLLLILGTIFWGMEGVERVEEVEKVMEIVNDSEVKSKELNAEKEKVEIGNRDLEIGKEKLEMKDLAVNGESNSMKPNLPIENKGIKSNPSQNNSTNIQSSQNPKAVVLEKVTDLKSNENKDFENISPNKEKLVDQSISNKDSLFVEPISILPLATIPTKWNIPLLIADSMILTSKSFLDSKKKINGFYAGLKFGPSNTYRKIKALGGFNIPDILTEGERANYSFSLGLNVGHQFSKNWSIESGFSYSNISFQTRSRRQVRYTMLNEQINASGEFERNYNLDVETSTGDINTDIAIAREASTPIAENESINIALRANQKIHFANIPILARYHIGNKKFQIGLKAGIVNRFTLKGTFQYESASIIRSGVRLILRDRFYSVRELKNLQSYQMDFLIGAGIRFHLSDKIWLYAEPTFMRSINPIHQNANFKTFPSVKSLDLGLNYRF